MELETLFTSSKWQILKRISKKPFSPLQLSTQLNTSIANISQQMRLLEFAGLLSKEKISTRESGKPRTLFSIKHDFAHIVLASQEGAKKGLIDIDKEKRMLINSWLSGDEDLNSTVRDWSVVLQDKWELIQGIVRVSKTKEILLISESTKEISKLTDKLSKTADDNNHKSRIISPKQFITLATAQDSLNISQTYDILMLENNLLKKIEEMI